MAKIKQLSRSILILCGLFGCSAVDDSDDSTAGTGAPTDTGPVVEPDPATVPVGEPGLHRENGELLFRTEPFTIAAGEERYPCWTTTTEEPLKVTETEFTGAPGIHHLTFAKTLAPEPAGFSDCPVLFKATWQPLLTAGAGALKVSLPDGVAHELPAGTQLLAQLHLFNTTEEDITQPVVVKLQTTDQPDTQPVQLGGFGTFQVSLPPLQTSALTHECTLPFGTRLVSLIPHMHQLGTSITLELGTSANDLQPVFTRDPWDFDQQTIENVDMTLEAGQYARVTCNYNNTTDRTVTYGESTLDEMCFIGLFSVGGGTLACVAF
jgi:hypothetical protein